MAKEADEHEASGEHEAINLQTVEDALYRHDTHDEPVQGKLTVMNQVPSERGQTQFGFWGISPVVGLTRILLEPEEQNLCRQLEDEILGLDPQIEKIVDQLDEKYPHPKVEICNVDDEDKPIGVTPTGLPMYKPDPAYDREKNW